jgi:hypothetical protein
VKHLPWIAAAVLLALLVRAVFPKTVTVTETITLPSNTDTVTVTVTVLDSVEKVVFRDRPVFTTDTLVLRDTVRVTAPDTVTVMPLTWYLTRLQSGHGLDSPTLVSRVGLKYDGSLTRSYALDQYPVTLGPVTDIVADSTGVHVNFGTWPDQPKSCGFGCKAQWLLGGLAAGVILWEVAR